VKSFREVRVESPAGLEDELVGRVFALGSLGSWTEHLADGRIRLHAFFHGSDDRLPGELAGALALPGVRLAGGGAVEDSDWLAAWRAAARPIPVGERFLVDPREPAEAREPIDSGGRFLLRLPARTAFGVGSHESTRLAVELLETLPVAGARVLDVGTGTGILAFAALRLGAAAVVACDLDPGAALLLPQFMQLNGIRFAAFAGSLQALSGRDRDQRKKPRTKAKSIAKTKSTGGGTSLGGARRFDLALVNVIPEEIEPDLPTLVTLLRPGGAAIFSGILSVSAPRVLARLSGLGFRRSARRSAGEWSAFVLELAP